MPLFIGENVYPIFTQFTPLGTATAPPSVPLNAKEGAMWYDNNSKSFKGLINGVATAVGGVSTPSFPVTVAGTVNSGGIPYFNSTTQESSSATLATNALVTGGGAGSAPTTGNADFTYSVHTLTAGASGIVDLHSAGAGGLLIPNATAVSADAIALLASNGQFTWGFGANTVYGTWAGAVNTQSTDCAFSGNQYLTAIKSAGGPTCSSLSLTNSTLQKAETGTADTNVLTFTPGAVAQTLRACFSASVSAATSGVISWTLSWTDSNGNAQSNIVQDLFQDGTAAPATSFTTSAAGNYHMCRVLDINNANASVIVKWVGGGTTTAKVSASVERLI